MLKESLENGDEEFGKLGHNLCRATAGAQDSCFKTCVRAGKKRWRPKKNQSQLQSPGIEVTSPGIEKAFRSIEKAFRSIERIPRKHLGSI